MVLADPPSGDGSSPRMRGKPGRRPRSWRCYRIIPAHAGQTPQTAHRPVEHPDHPRTCGANAPNTVFLMPRTGSSPHMRGKLSDSRPPPQSPRIIPAHAGQTSNPRRKSWKPTDHPRICGENVDSAIQSNPPDGSSPHMRGKLGTVSTLSTIGRIIPHMRGKPLQNSEKISDHRIIPAHAGQTPIRHHS